jgi:hypothetical protein
MINPYFYYIIISNGGLYSYNFERKKVMANPVAMSNDITNLQVLQSHSPELLKVLDLVIEMQAIKAGLHETVLETSQMCSDVLDIARETDSII